MSFIYVASPYSHPEESVRQARYEAVSAFTAMYIERGFVVYSPIVHNHLLARRLPALGLSFSDWSRHNFGILAKASELWVLTIPGYESSLGVQSEVALAEQLGITTYLKGMV